MPKACKQRLTDGSIHACLMFDAPAFLRLGCLKSHPAGIAWFLICPDSALHCWNHPPVLRVELHFFIFAPSSGFAAVECADLSVQRQRGRDRQANSGV